MADGNNCLHDDCFTCPYPDCISSKEPKKHKPGRKRLAPEEQKRRRREAQKKYSEANREAINRKHRAYYHSRKNGANGAAGSS